MIFPQTFQFLEKKQWDNGYLKTYSKDGKSQTLKVFSKNFQQFFIEISICQRLRHNACCIQLANYFESDIEKAILFDNYSQDIKDFLSENSINDLDKFIIFGQIVKAFKSIQEDLSTTNQIFQHRDIKPENIILGEGNKIKIAGFGMSKLIKYEDESDSYNSTQQFGTSGYMDPVMEYLGEGFQQNSDLWSLGATLFAILTMKTLSFEEIKGKSKLFLSSDKKTKIQILQEIVDKNINNNIKNNECKSLLKNLLNVDQSKRYDWNDFYSDGFILQLLEITKMQNL